MKTNNQFVEYLKKQLNKNTVYMWGDYGRLVTNNTISSKARQYPSHYDENKKAYLKTLVGKNYYSFDCAGLIKSYWMSGFGTKDVKYDAHYDKDAYGITIKTASKVGDISTLPEIPGILLYMKGHCGVYIGNKEVIECTSNEKVSKTKYGKVCLSKISDRAWTNWTMSKWIDYEMKDKEIEANISYIIKKRDTLSSIAKKYNTTVEVLEKVNNISNVNVIYAGDYLMIPNTKTYTAKKG